MEETDAYQKNPRKALTCVASERFFWRAEAVKKTWKGGVEVEKRKEKLIFDGSFDHNKNSVCQHGSIAWPCSVLSICTLYSLYVDCVSSRMEIAHYRGPMTTVVTLWIVKCELWICEEDTTRGWWQDFNYVHRWSLLGMFVFTHSFLEFLLTMILLLLSTVP